MLTLAAMPSARTTTAYAKRIFQQLTKSKPEIQDSVFDEVHATHVAALFLSLLDAAQRPQRSVARLVWRPPARDLGFGAPFDVVAEFVFEIPLDLIPPEQRPQSQRDRVQQAQQTHNYISFSRTTREMAPESRSQLAASRSSASRPARVSL